jgi:hypothetical protein
LLISGVAITAVAMGVGAALTRNSNPVAPAVNAGPPSSGYKNFEIAVRSIPEGAEIWQVGANRKLGVTDTILKFEMKDEAKISLVFRKEGYIEETREVSPYTMLVHLKEDTRHRERPERPISGSRGGSGSLGSPSGGSGTPTPSPSDPPPPSTQPVPPATPPAPSAVVTPPPIAPTPAGAAAVGPPASATQPVPSAPSNTPRSARRKPFKSNEIVNPFGGPAE